VCNRIGDYHISCVTDAPVRAELMTQLPHIAMLCHEDKNRLHSLVLDHLLPLVIKCLADSDGLVRVSFSTFIDCTEAGMPKH
jgi:hypothetical protein